MLADAFVGVVGRGVVVLVHQLLQVAEAAREAKVLADLTAVALVSVVVLAFNRRRR